MRRLILVTGAVAFFTLAGSASAQFGLPGGGAMGGPTGSSGTATSFFSQTMAKPSFAAMSVRPPMPTPFSYNFASMLPRMPSFQNSMLMRNFFGSQMSVQIPRQATPPPK